MSDYDGWVTLATMDDHTPMWSGPKDLAEEFLASEIGLNMIKALSFQGVALTTIPFGEV